MNNYNSSFFPVPIPGPGPGFMPCNDWDLIPPERQYRHYWMTHDGLPLYWWTLQEWHGHHRPRESRRRTASCSHSHSRGRDRSRHRGHSGHDGDRRRLSAGHYRGPADRPTSLEDAHDNGSWERCRCRCRVPHSHRDHQRCHERKEARLAIAGGGGGRIVLHVDSDPGRTVIFEVAPWRMRRLARHFDGVCKPHTTTMETRVPNEDAVTAMHWLLRVLHREPRRRDRRRNTRRDDNDDDDNDDDAANDDRPPPIPDRLPASVVAFVAMFGRQLGALAASGPLARQTERWLWALVDQPPPPRRLHPDEVSDWASMLYAARALNHPGLLAWCQGR